MKLKTILSALILLIPCEFAWSSSFTFQTEIDAFYYAREGKPLWVDQDRLNPNGRILLKTLKDSWQHGLNPDHYNVNKVKGLNPVQIELLLTQGLVKYAQDLSGMRIDATEIGLEPAQWKQRKSALQVLQDLAGNINKFSSYIKRLGPQTNTYQTLRDEMIITQSVEKRKKIALNMERLRWLPAANSNRFIIVNAPSERLWAVEDGKVAFEMPVIVGSKERPTLSFITNIMGVRFNPTWTIPPTIKEKDIWPSLKNDPKFLTTKGIELYEDNITLDPSIIDWHQMSRLELHRFRMVQMPGPTNPLGRIRILMPNKHAIFLHDTSQRALFTNGDRSTSSGCVRLSEPERMARFILEDWSDKDIDKALKKNKTKDILIEHKIPVFLVYYTAWIGKYHQIVYGEDVYGYDKKLTEAIEKLNGFPDF